MPANNVTNTAIELLATAATAQFGPLGALVVNLGAPLAVSAISKYYKGRALSQLTREEIAVAARELLTSAPSFEDAVKAGEAAGRIDSSEPPPTGTAGA